jgi:hypothetical protein
MRHLIGIILAIVLGAALFFGAGGGYTRLTSIAAHGGSLTSTTGLIALAALAATGLFIGILIAVRAISPLAPGLPGLALLAGSAVLALRAQQVLRWIPLQGHSYGAGFRALLVSGVLALLGAALIVPLFVPARWRGTHPEDGEDEDSVLTGLLSAPSAVPAGGQADLSEPR